MDNKDIERTLERVEGKGCDVDGYFRVIVNAQQVDLSVFPPVGKGRMVLITDILAELSLRGVSDYDMPMIQKTCYQPAREPAKIANSPPGYSATGQITFDISEDKLQAYVSVNPPESTAFTGADILKVLGESGIKYGVDKVAIDRLLSEGDFGHIVVVARGLPPQDGVDGQIEYKFKIDHDCKPAENEDGTVDYHDLNLLENIIEGQVLAEYTPHTMGTEGVDVCGTAIAALPGKPGKFIPGKNCSYSLDNENVIVADESGHVSLENEKVEVTTVYEVRGDVGVATGNIEYVGSVRISGNVKSGYSVKSGGSIEVKGVVEAAYLEAEEHVMVKGGMVGGYKGEIHAKGDISLYFVENGLVRSRGSVIVGSELMHSRVVADKVIDVTSGKGTIFGGDIQAGEEVRAKVLGSSIATQTEVRVGCDPVLLENIRKTKAALDQTTINYKKTSEGLHALKIVELKEGKLSYEKMLLQKKLAAAEVTMKEQVASLTTRLAGLMDQRLSSKSGTVKVLQKVNPGVKIIIGNTVRFFIEEFEGQNNMLFYVKGGKVQVGSFIPGRR